jgi:hypothetical protein
MHISKYLFKLNYFHIQKINNKTALVKPSNKHVLYQYYYNC